MSIKIGRIILAAILVEFLAVLALVLIVALFGPTEPAAAQVYAEHLGYWVGPIAGFLFTLAGGWWIAKGIARSHLLNGFILGIIVAIVDITILVLSGADFQPIFAISNIGRIVAGTIGGWIGSRHGQNEA